MVLEECFIKLLFKQHMDSGHSFVHYNYRYFSAAATDRTIARIVCLRSVQSSDQAVTTSANSSRPSAIG